MGKLIGFLVGLSIFIFPNRFLFENFLKIITNLIIEIKYISRRLLLEEKTPLLVTIFSALMILFGIALFHIFACLPICWLRSPSFRASKSFKIVQDLNLNRRFYLLVYYGHFITLRILIALLILLTDTCSSKSIWIGISAIQLLCLSLHFIKLYKAWTDYLFALIWEITLLQVFLHLTLLQYKGGTT